MYFAWVTADFATKVTYSNILKLVFVPSTSFYWATDDLYTVVASRVESLPAFAAVADIRR